MPSSLTNLVYAPFRYFPHSQSPCHGFISTMEAYVIRKQTIPRNSPVQVTITNRRTNDSRPTTTSATQLRNLSISEASFHDRQRDDNLTDDIFHHGNFIVEISLRLPLFDLLLRHPKKKPLDRPSSASLSLSLTLEFLSESSLVPG